MAERMDELEIQLELGGDHNYDDSTGWNDFSAFASTATEVRARHG
jgi:hypothetical protein